MRILFCGDIVGRSGREAVIARVPDLKARLAADFVVVNAENAAGGYGITDKICAELYRSGVDALTLGNHAWDQRALLGYIDRDPRLLRPANFPPTTPGRGAQIFQLPGGRKILVVNLMGRLFMDPLDCPFQTIDRELVKAPLARGAAAILVDIHAEASSEKMALAHHLDGRVSAVIGTHTHIPTADAQILPGGTGFQSDAGMCGDYDSVIGMRKEQAVYKFVRKLPTEKKLEPSEGPGTVCGVLIVTDDRTGLTTAIEPVRLGGRLKESVPAV